MAKNNLNDVLRNLGREETPPDIHRMAEELAGRLRRDLIQTRQPEHPFWREFIMRNRIVQLAAVVAILAGVGVVSYYLGGSPGGASVTWGEDVAWGEVLTQVQNAPTVTYKAHLTMNDPQGWQVVDESDVYVDQN